MAKVYITRRRGRLSLCWRDGRRVKYKAPSSQDPVQVEIDRRQHQDDLALGAKDAFAKYRKTTVLEHADELLQQRRKAADAGRLTHSQVTEVDRRLRRVLNAASIRFIADISETKVETAVLGLRLMPQAKKPKGEGRPASARTRNAHRKAIIHFCRWLVRAKRARENPLPVLEMENEKLDRKHPRGALSDDEFAKMIATARAGTKVIEGADGLYRARLYHIAELTGLRKGDLASLTPRHFKLDGKTPVVTIKAGDSKHRDEDTLPLHPSVVADLLPWLAMLGPDEPLFEHLRTRKTEEMVKFDLKAAGVPYVLNGLYRDFHAVRHRFITSLWRAKVSPFAIMKLARHRDLRTTLRYSHCELEEQAAAIRKLPGKVKAKPKKRNKAG